MDRRRLDPFAQRTGGGGAGHEQASQRQFSAK